MRSLICLSIVVLTSTSAQAAGILWLPARTRVLTKLAVQRARVDAFSRLPRFSRAGRARLKRASLAAVVRQGDLTWATLKDDVAKDGGSKVVSAHNGRGTATAYEFMALNGTSHELGVTSIGPGFDEISTHISSRTSTGQRSYGFAVVTGGKHLAETSPLVATPRVSYKEKITLGTLLDPEPQLEQKRARSYTQRIAPVDTQTRALHRQELLEAVAKGQGYQGLLDSLQGIIDGGVSAKMAGRLQPVIRQLRTAPGKDSAHSPAAGVFWANLDKDTTLMVRIGSAVEVTIRGKKTVRLSVDGGELLYEAKGLRGHKKVSVSLYEALNGPLRRVEETHAQSSTTGAGAHEVPEL